MKNPAKDLKRLYIAFGVVVAIAIAVIIAGATSAQQDIQKAVKAAETPAPVKVDTKPEAPAKPQQSVKNDVSDRTSSPVPVNNTVAAPQETTGGEVPETPHVPFTTKPVTPGDPESYVDTVGQCPFYEMGGPKGCVVPPDVECNADWSECHMKDQ